MEKEIVRSYLIVRELGAWIQYDVTDSKMDILIEKTKSKDISLKLVYHTAVYIDSNEQYVNLEDKHVHIAMLLTSQQCSDAMDILSSYIDDIDNPNLEKQLIIDLNTYRISVIGQYLDGRTIKYKTNTFMEICNHPFREDRLQVVTCSSKHTHDCAKSDCLA